jgi:hypothetical protein
MIYKKTRSQVLGAHACKPSYLGGRDQEDHGAKPAWAKQIVCKTLSQKNKSQKVLVEWLKL